MTQKYDVFGVGNAIVDILAQIPEDALTELAVNKGAMTLMEPPQQAGVLNYLEGKSLSRASGGSAANTMVAIAQSGGSGIYAGKVANDPNGKFYHQDLKAAGIECYVPPASETDLPTGTSVILTTPDAERTMCTHLGISATLTENDIDVQLLAQCQYCYVEGYLWTGEPTRKASLKALEAAKENNVKTAFTFSDSFLVDLFQDDFRSLVTQNCDTVFCNADEARKFFGHEDPAECAKQMSDLCELGFITDGPNGCHVSENGMVTNVAGFKVNAVDTVGAGDAFAGGVLYGLTNGMSAVDAAKWGNYFASQVVGRFGPRMDTPMQDQLDLIMNS
ncbi:MAG: adenosine kinase [Mariniblastus sp.]|nr:adenosine kinase [Mariniblastus sp.]